LSKIVQRAKDQTVERKKSNENLKEIPFLCRFSSTV